jgi:hypothetical protein
MPVEMEQNLSQAMPESYCVFNQKQQSFLTFDVNLAHKLPCRREGPYWRDHKTKIAPPTGIKRRSAVTGT